MAQTPVIGVLGAVVAAGLGYYYFTKREEATETTTTVTPAVTPTETTPLDNFTKKTGSLYQSAQKPQWPAR